MFFNVFYKSEKNMFFMFFYSKIIVFIIYAVNARRLLAVAFIASRVDYCNAVGLLFGILDRVLQQLQMVMNAAARFVARMGSLHTSHQFYATCFTGSRSPRELSSRSLCWLLSVFGAWGRRISCASVFPCLTTLPSPVFVLLNAATCS